MLHMKENDLGHCIWYLDNRMPVWSRCRREERRFCPCWESNPGSFVIQFI